MPIGWSEPYTALAEAYTKAGKAGDGRVGDRDGRPGRRQGRLAEPRLLAIADGRAAVDATIGLGLIVRDDGRHRPVAEWYVKALADEPDNAAARLGMSRVGRR